MSAEQYAATIRESLRLATYGPKREECAGFGLSIRECEKAEAALAALLEQQQQQPTGTCAGCGLPYGAVLLDTSALLPKQDEPWLSAADRIEHFKARAARAERQQAEAEAAYAAELGLRLATERLLDEARDLIEAGLGIGPLAEPARWNPKARAWLARLGAAAPQQEPATSGDEPGGSSVAEVSE